MIRGLLPMRVLLPLATLLVFLLISLSSGINQYVLFERQLMAEAPQSVRSILIATQRHLEGFLAHNDFVALEAEVVNLAVLSEVRESALIDSSGKVLASTVTGRKGLPVREVIPAVHMDSLRQAMNTRQPVMETLDGAGLHVYFPVIGQKTHVLFVDWNLQPQMKRLAGSIIFNALVFWLVGAVMLVVLMAWLNRAITRPLKLLEDRVNLLDGEGGGPDFGLNSGAREIRSLASAMQMMKDRLRYSYAGLRASEQSYRRLFNMAQEGIWVVDENGYTVMVNPAMAAMLEYAPEEMAGRHFNEFTDENGRRQFAEVMQKRHAETATHHDYVLSTRSGKQLQTVFQGAGLFDEQGRYMGGIAGVIDMTERHEAEMIITRQANYDSLTQLPNRRRMTEILEREMGRARRHGHVGAVLFIDVDHFKNINDSLGHPVGDRLLVEIGARLQGCLRKEDTLARLGGDEFVVLLPELDASVQKALGGAQIAAIKLQEAAAQGFEVDGHRLNVTCSIGITLFPQDQETIHDIIRQADTAMYRSKQDGRNLVRFFTHELQQEAERKLQIQLMLPRALEEEQFQLYFQPQLDNREQLIGAEALLRWVHPERGFISPAHFIGAAEESGLILPLGDWVIRKACEYLKGWQAGGLPANFQRVAINISPRQFMVDDFAGHVCELMAAAGVSPERIELEITEGMLMSNLDLTIPKMKTLREAGFHLSIDDFGTGYSCLNYLKNLPISKLKIDQSFTRDLSSDLSDRSIVQTIIMMAKNLDLDVLAEGVETREQFQFLDQEGCHKYQGYYFGKPVPAAEFLEKWLRRAPVQDAGDAS